MHNPTSKGGKLIRFETLLCDIGRFRKVMEEFKNQYPVWWKSSTGELLTFYKERNEKIIIVKNDPEHADIGSAGRIAGRLVSVDLTPPERGVWYVFKCGQDGNRCASACIEAYDKVSPDEYGPYARTSSNRVTSVMFFDDYPSGLGPLGEAFEEFCTAVLGQVARAVTATTQPTAYIQPALPPSQATFPSSSAPNTQSDTILLVAVTKVEVLAIRETFSRSTGKEWARKQIGNKTYYNLDVHGGAPVFMVQSEGGTATPGGSLLTVRQAIQDLRPQAVIMCGIAFGLRPDKQRLGDILVAKQLQYYEPQKVDFQKGQMPRGDRSTSAERLLDRFRSGDNDWQGAPTHFGLVLSGEKLVDDPAFRDWLLKTEPEAVGGEMEGAGLYAAARDAKVDWILVKAICDWADGKKNDDAQPLAARNAAQFVLHVLQLGGWNGPQQLPVTQIPNSKVKEVQRSISDARQELIETEQNMEIVSKQYDLPKLQRDIAGHLNKEEMRSLCFEMGIADEDLPSETLTGMARELVKYCQRREWIPNLLEHLAMSRPDFDWNKFREAVKEVAIPRDFKEEHPELGYCIFWGGGQYGIEPTPPSDAIKVEGKITVETESHDTNSNTIAFWLEDGRLGTLQIHASLRGNGPKRWPIVSFSGRWWVKNLTMIKFRDVGEQG